MQSPQATFDTRAAKAGVARKRPQNCLCGRFAEGVTVSYGKNGKRIGRRIMLTMVDTRINGKPAFA